MKVMIDENDREMINDPVEDLQADDPMQQNHADNDIQADTSHGERSDVPSIIENLERNMSTTYGLDGKAYRIGISVKGLIAQIEFMQHVIDTHDLPYAQSKAILTERSSPSLARWRISWTYYPASAV
ncbi:hypothetical protein [Castellaniella caeni]|uniref:hypothetical protein n=1 Tax=Castellaniella caeni TaxID=266123 RepID=UPI0011AFBD61|nr:hypothetical protein [Castellaniella caeni]